MKIHVYCDKCHHMTTIIVHLDEGFWVCPVCHTKHPISKFKKRQLTLDDFS